MENINIKPFEIKKVQKIIESKESNSLLNCIETLEIYAEKIGEGGNADILAVSQGPFSKVCLKKIKEKPQLICNSIDRENEFQEKAREAGVRTPLTLISFETEGGGNYFVMEKIIGSNLEEVLIDSSLLPENFSYDLFIKDLEDQVQKMHNAGIYHRDLHNRNVMVNEKGLPVIIDFGTATEGTGSDFTYEELANVYNSSKGTYEQVSGKFKDDLQMLKNMKSALVAIRYKKN